MSGLDNLKREVSESVAQNKVLVTAVNNLRSDVQTVNQRLTDYIAAHPDLDDTELQAMADELDASQKAAQEVLDQNSVPTNPGEPAPEGPQTGDQEPGTGGQPAEGTGSDTPPTETPPTEGNEVEANRRSDLV